MIRPSLSDFGTHDESAYPELWRGVVGAWCPSLGPTGSRLHDFSRRNNWGTLTNMDAATNWVVSDGRYALDFDGVNDFVGCGPLGISAGTVTLWLRFTAAADNRIFSNNGTGTGVDGATRVENAKVEVWSGRTGNWRTLWTEAATSTWYHFAFVYAASTVTLFVNGRQQSSGAAEFDFVTTRLEIGNRFENYGTTFQGQQDDFRVYRRSLSQAEILLLASDRGIAYERRKRRSFFATMVPNLRRRLLLTGQT